MSRKYTPPKKKRKSVNQIARAQTTASAGAAVQEFSMARPSAPRVNAIPVTQADDVKYADLPFELRRIAFFTGAALVLLLVLWLILR